MTDHDAVVELALDLVRIDSRSSVSNLAVAERLEAALGGFAIERLDFADPAGTAKRALVAHRGPLGAGGLALSGHMDTVPDTGWEEDPWAGRVDGTGVLHALGAADMKGPLAAIVVAARTLPAAVPVTLLLTTDEETTKQGARVIAQRSELAREAAPRGILVAEPTGMVPVRGHRAHIAFTARALGVQAHSSRREADNANWKLIPFLAAMRELHARILSDPSLRDEGYDPPWSDFNLVIDNHGTAVNVSVPLATARIKYRYSRRLDIAPVLEAVRAAAAAAGVALEELREGEPPELPADHPLVAFAAALTGAAPRTVSYGTDASQLQALAPCVILGPGAMDTAHTPRECVRLSDLSDAVPLYRRLLTEGR